MNSKLLIANRGEIACRIVNAARKMGIATVGVYAADDATMRHVGYADESIELVGQRLSETYLNGTQLIAVAQKTGATLIHPGYGFLSETAAFARAVRDGGLTWIGPPPEVIAQMGSKIAAKQEAALAKVPTLPWHLFSTAKLTKAELKKEADRIGYPLVIKASGGGGGKGMRLVTDPNQLIEAYEACVREAVSSFGDASVFLEKFLESARHIEVQILADQQGNMVHLYDRECSAQRRHQKVIEEAPAPNLSATARRALHDAAVRFAKSIGYQNAGTIEFLVDDDANFYFLEMNTRLQVEHPVTEWITGVDIVEQQIRIASGEKLPWKQAKIPLCGHAIEARIYAEDPFNGFMPTPGAVHALSWPAGAGIRIDSGVQEKSIISPNYDPMVAKISVGGKNRREAAHQLITALNGTTLLGLMHNIEFLKGVLQSPEFQHSKIKTNTLETGFRHEADRLISRELVERLVTALIQPLQSKPVFSPDDEEIPNLFGVIRL